MAARLFAIAVLLLGWFGLAGDVSVPELVADLAVTATCVASLVAIRRRAKLPSAPRMRWFVEALVSWPRRIISDVPRVLASVLRRHAPKGALRVVDLPHAAPIEVAWAVVGTSISPNAYVIGWDDARRRVLVHELVPTDQTDDEVVWRPR